MTQTQRDLRNTAILLGVLMVQSYVRGGTFQLVVVGAMIVTSIVVLAVQSWYMGER